jgi:hypothetical protein
VKRSHQSHPAPPLRPALPGNGSDHTPMELLEYGPDLASTLAFCGIQGRVWEEAGRPAGIMDLPGP